MSKSGSNNTKISQSVERIGGSGFLVVRYFLPQALSTSLYTATKEKCPSDSPFVETSALGEEYWQLIRLVGDALSAAYSDVSFFGHDQISYNFNSPGWHHDGASLVELRTEHADLVGYQNNIRCVMYPNSNPDREIEFNIIPWSHKFPFLARWPIREAIKKNIKMGPTDILLFDVMAYHSASFREVSDKAMITLTFDANQPFPARQKLFEHQSVSRGNCTTISDIRSNAPEYAPF